MLKKIATAAGLGLLVSGCAMTLAVQGQSNDGTELFTGSATGYMDGGGTLSIKSNRGRSCTGKGQFGFHFTGDDFGGHV